MRLNSKVLSLFLPIIVLTLSGCHDTKRSPLVDAKPVMVTTCASATRDPIILTACMDFGSEPLTMDERYDRVKSCLLFADSEYAKQLKLNRPVKLTQTQWKLLETYRTKELTLCVLYGRSLFPSTREVEDDRRNLLFPKK